MAVRDADASALEAIRSAAVEALGHAGVDPEADPDAVARAVEAEVDRYQRRVAVGDATALADPAATAAAVVRSVLRLGALSDLVESRTVEEIFVEGDRVACIEHGRLRVLLEPTTEADNYRVVAALVAPTGRPLDATHPLVQVQVLGGQARLTAAVPPVSRRLSATLRKYVVRRATFEALTESGTLSYAAAIFLALLAKSLGTLVVSGRPGAGKSTLLAAFLAAVPAGDCVRVCEEHHELFLPRAHGSSYQTVPPDVEGRGGVDLRQLIKFVLAMHPDMIGVGEVRSSESFELSRAVNAGTGFCTTIHSNSALDALEALVSTAIMAGENVPERAVRKIFGSSIDVVVHVDRDDPNALRPGEVLRRRVTEVDVVAPSADADAFATEPLFRRRSLDAPLEWTGTMPPTGLVARLERVLPPGTSLRDVLAGEAKPG